jgi:L-iditol 2-dehydrogenase
LAQPTLSLPQIPATFTRTPAQMDQICFRELIVTRSNASVPSSWICALQLLKSGLVQTTPLILHRYSVEDWETAFNGFGGKQSIKVLLIPAE